MIGGSEVDAGGPPSGSETRGPRPEARGPSDLSLPPGTIASAIASAKPLPKPIVPSGKLEPAGPRGAVAHDLVTTMHVAPDGHATFADKPDFEAHWSLPIPSMDSLRHPEKAMRELGNGVAAMVDEWYKDPYAQTRAPAVGDLPPHERAVEGGWDSLSGGGGGIPVAGGGFDITAWATRKAGGDPYAARKQKLLDQTRAERMEMKRTHTSRQLARASEIMRGNLERMWAKTPDAARRRHALFELWDECEEGEGPTGEAGQRARNQVIGWIRARLPAGGADAFSAEEILAYDRRRRSIQHFEPY